VASGFVGPDEIDGADEVAAFNIASGTLHWRPILSRVDRPLAAGEDMYGLALPGVDLRVTGGHRLVYCYAYGKSWQHKTPWMLAEAAKVAQRASAYSIPVAAQEVGGRGVPLSDAEIAFLGWFITDGTLNRRTSEVNIYQAAASQFIANIQECLDACGFAWSVNSSGGDTQFNRRSPMRRYRIPKFRSRTGRTGRGWAEMEPYLDKGLSPLLDGIDARQLAILLEAMHMGDGNKQRNQPWTQRSYHIGISRRVLADRLQSLCVRRGWRANISSRKTPLGRDHYTLHVKPGATRAIGGTSNRKPHLIRVPACPGERVWCVENDLGTVVIRRNGKTAIVGNCIGRLARDGQENTVVAYFMTSDDGTDPHMAEVLGLKRAQAVPIRDPKAELFEALTPEADRARTLAAAVLKRAAMRQARR
jgi:hypothetical protein